RTSGSTSTTSGRRRRRPSGRRSAELRIRLVQTHTAPASHRWLTSSAAFLFLSVGGVTELVSSVQLSEYDRPPPPRTGAAPAPHDDLSPHKTDTAASSGSRYGSECDCPGSDGAAHRRRRRKSRLGEH